MLIIGIGGGTGSGKTTVVNQIISEFPKGEVQVISQDSYYNDTSHLTYKDRCKINFDHPKSIDFKLLETHLKDLKQGKSVKQPIYSFKTHNRTGDTTLTEPKKVIIVEGILILSDTQLRTILDIKIFVHADSDERLMRRIKRDLAERGRDLVEVLDRYQTTLKPMHQQFIEPMKAYADIIIPNNNYNSVAVNVVKSIINDQL
ncbi:MAG: uridine kinase [Flavobacteriaceae bacterium]|nr:uridine kinase [Flavobacteriaceae bacterium]